MAAEARPAGWDSRSSSLRLEGLVGGEVFEEFDFFAVVEGVEEGFGHEGLVAEVAFGDV